MVNLRLAETYKDLLMYWIMKNKRFYNNISHMLSISELPQNLKVESWLGSYQKNIMLHCL